MRARLVLPTVTTVIALVLMAASVGIGQDKPGGAVLDSESFGDLRARAIGPAVMSGRIAALDVVADDPRIMALRSAACTRRRVR